LIKRQKKKNKKLVEEDDDDDDDEEEEKKKPIHARASGERRVRPGIGGAKESVGRRLRRADGSLISIRLSYRLLRSRYEHKHTHICIRFTFIRL